MPYYFYITTIFVVVIYLIIHEIYLFKKGRYYPYIGRNKGDSLKKRVFDIGLNIVVCVSLIKLILSYDRTEQPIYVLALSVIALALCENILNFLSYLKIKDPKIIYQTLIVDFCIIVLFLIIRLF